MKKINLQDALNKIKELIEKAIKTNGIDGKNNLIRTSKPIQLIHEAIKTELIKNKINKDLIIPNIGKSIQELKLASYFKFKNQDISVLSKKINKVKEILSFDGILKGQEDIYGKLFTERVLAINVRSQLSSMAKNFDTLYERTFAESLNLHLRCPKMVLGEFYMIAVKELNSDSAKNKIVKYENNKNLADHIEKYILSFNAINNRKEIEKDHFKYERVCLLIVDFSKNIPKIFHNNDELIKEGLITKEIKYMTELNFDSFIPELLKIYKTRFGTDNFN